MPKAPPWKKPRPKQPKKKLTAAQIARARARAKRAGRRYPNLVDNMWAASRKPRGANRRSKPKSRA